MSFDPVTAGLEFVSKIADKIWPDPTAKAEGMLKLRELEQKGELAQLAADTELAKAQMQINTEEAKSGSLFVSGWRPFIGWVCGGAFAYHFILQPLIAFLLATQGQSVELPAFDIYSILTVLCGMLGLGSLRTVEKWKGVAR
ncbi:MAG: holin family protein [Bdellovibrionales bacterium]